MLQPISGYKTYLAAFAIFAFACIGLYAGRLTGTEATALILNALAVAGLRSAISEQRQ